MQQQLRALNMSQKSIAQTRAGVRTFDQSRYVGDHESFEVTEIDYLKVRLKGRERIVRNLRTRRRHRRDKRRLARIRETNETNICEQLQLELKIQFFALASVLMIARSAIRRSREVGVAKTAAATACS